MTVHEAAKRAGVSERTLRYYDRIGLLKPAATSDAGYRLYDGESLQRLQQILFLRELDFPLREIAPMLQAEACDRKRAVRRHRELLTMKAKRLQGLIDLCERVEKGEDLMSVREFDTADVQNARDDYARETKERWGGTEAYRAWEKRTAAYGDAEWNEARAEGDAILQEIAALTGKNPECAEVQAAITKWREHISARYYPCTEEILKGLGQMYAADERFAKTLDSYAPGTANLMSEAIRLR